MFILPKDGGLDHPFVGGADPGGARTDGRFAVRQGRHANHHTGGHAVRRLDAGTVDADLAGAAQLFNCALGHMREAAAQPLVKALFALIHSHGQLLDGHRAAFIRATPSATAARERATEPPT